MKKFFPTAVKDKKIDTQELDKIREKAWKEGRVILY